MANLIQLKRASAWNVSEDPGATTLAEGELAWNNQGKKLWMGRKIATTGTTHELLRVNKSVSGTGNQVTVTEGAEGFTVSLPNQVSIADLTLSGNLTVSGTTTTVNSTVVTVDDPIFTLGGDGSGLDDDKDRGIELKWHNGSAAKVGFFGRNDNTGRFAYIADATNSSEVFSGTLGDAEFTTVYANVTGDVTGNTSGSSGSCTGNAATVTTNANLTGDITSVGNATVIAAGVIVDADVKSDAAIAYSKLGAIPTWNQNTTGNAATVTNGLYTNSTIDGGTF